jgi:biotin carboxyl carrier protein
MLLEHPDRRLLAPHFERLEALRLFNGAPGEFWPRFLQLTLAFGEAAEALVLTRSRAGAAGWKEAAVWPAQSQLPAALKAAKGDADRLLLEAEAGGESSAPARGWLALRVPTGDRDTSVVLAVGLKPQADGAEAATRLRLLADVPLLYERNRGAAQVQSDLARFAVTLDLLVLLDAQVHFVAAAMTLCNELTARFSCDRVSIGWLQNRFVRLQAVSHTEHFEKKMALVSGLEQAMDEALDQDEEILWPAPEECTAVVRDHEEFARAQGVPHLLSLPIRLETEPVGVLTLERAATPFTVREMQTLRLLCDHVARRLQTLKTHDRWWGARLLTAARERAVKLIGPEHTVAKLAAVAAFVLMAVLVFGRAQYRVEAPFILKSDALAQITAPFDGFIDEVRVRVGDPVEAGRPLFLLDTRELFLQEAGAIAERVRFLAEAQKAESEGNVADMQIARASADEAAARLALVRYRLKQATVLAPFAGYVVEGDLRERISAPVKQGEVLVKVARIEAMFAEVSLPERDVHEVRAGERGEIAFASRPQFTFPVTVERVEPIAEVRDKGNVFVVRAELPAGAQMWWRPGMSGVCKLDAGRRGLLWIVTHRTVDFLRLHLWW